MSISKITTPLNNSQLVAKINEVIDAINNYATEKPCVSAVAVSGTTMTITFTDNSTAERTLPDTMYSVATTSANGLMSATMVTSLNTLTSDVASLMERVEALEPGSNSGSYPWNN